MSGRVADRKRLLRVTAGNLRQSHIYINGQYDFFPEDCVGPSRKGCASTDSEIEIFLDGLNETVRTDIGRHANTGRPRGFFRGRSWVRRFFEYHKIRVGDVLAIERRGHRRYRMYPFDAKAERELDWHRFLEEPPHGEAPTVLELFAGCGGMLVGFKKAGFRTVLAVEWDAAACATIRTNLTECVAQCAIQEIDRFPRADVVAGGPPCQGFSNLGERVPNDPRRQFWDQFLRAVVHSDQVAM